MAGLLDLVAESHMGAPELSDILMSHASEPGGPKGVAQRLGTRGKVCLFGRDQEERTRTLARLPDVATGACAHFASSAMRRMK
jgi:hypothetical protein